MAWCMPCSRTVPYVPWSLERDSYTPAHLRKQMRWWNAYWYPIHPLLIPISPSNFSLLKNTKQLRWFVGHSQQNDSEDLLSLWTVDHVIWPSPSEKLEVGPSTMRNDQIPWFKTSFSLICSNSLCGSFGCQNHVILEISKTHLVGPWLHPPVAQTSGLRSEGGGNWDLPKYQRFVFAKGLMCMHVQ